jgi:hypothetical protein
MARVGMPSYLPSDPSNIDLIEDLNSSFEAANGDAMNESDFEIINASLIEQEMMEEKCDNQCKSNIEVPIDSIHLGRARGSYSSSMDSDYPVCSYSQDVQSAIDGILYIAQRLKNENEENKVIHDWQFIAMVLDRLFLWIFTLICLIGSAIILLRAPSLYDQTVPIDTILSNIGR